MNTDRENLQLLPSYRPWFAPLLGQLDQASKQSKLPHGILVVGQAYIGKSIFADYLGGLLLCQGEWAHENGQLKPCGQCRVCQLSSIDLHPDRYELCVESGKKTLSVDQVRGLKSKLEETSQLGGRRVVSIPELDLLTESAANALLKVLEEPPNETFFVLCSSKPQSLLPTIKSRCVQLLLQCPSETELHSWLSKYFSEQYSDHQLTSVITMARGLPERALSLLDAENTVFDIDKLLSQFAAQQLSAAKLLEKIDSGNAELFIEQFQLQVGQRLVFLSQQSIGLSGHQSQKQNDRKALLNFLDRLLDSKRLLARNANPKLLLESALQMVPPSFFRPAS